MSRHPRERTVVVLLAMIGSLVVELPQASASETPHSAVFGGSSKVGAIFTSSNGKLGSHFCSGSVVDSPGGDLVLTAAHCVSGSAPGTLAFVPDYNKGAAPYGVWRVTDVFVDAAWTLSADPDDDFAFLTVSRPGHRSSIQSVTGAERIATGVAPTQLLRVIGYPMSSNAPITCENKGSSFSATQIQFDCDGYSDGTSGGPMLLATSKTAGAKVIGVIGGYQLGGDTPAISYAAAFRADLTTLYDAATA